MPASGILGGLGLRSFSLAASTQLKAPTGGNTVSPLTTTTQALPMTLPSTSAGGDAARRSACLGWGSWQQPKRLRHHCSGSWCPSSETPPGRADHRGKSVDLGELPPAKDQPSPVTWRERSYSCKQYLQSKKHIPDLAKWMQCFAIYSAVLLTKHPDRAQMLLMYSAIMARLSKKFQWPSWIIL